MQTKQEQQQKNEGNQKAEQKKKLDALNAIKAAAEAKAKSVEVAAKEQSKKALETDKKRIEALAEQAKKKAAQIAMEIQQKKAAEQQTKAQEVQSKNVIKQKAENAAKLVAQKAAAAEQAIKLADKQKNALGRTCNCRMFDMPWDAGRPEKLCPNGYLWSGFLRNQRDFLSGIRQYKCCQPCKDDGHTVMPITNCGWANWWSSFDYQGWSMCGDSQAFISGFWKNNCDWIYCLEQAMCCRIGGSKGPKDCSDRNWWSSLDSAGLSQLSDNRFARGLYRTGDNYLHNIETPKECSFFAY